MISLDDLRDLSRLLSGEATFLVLLKHTIFQIAFQSFKTADSEVVMNRRVSFGFLSSSIWRLASVSVPLN